MTDMTDTLNGGPATEDSIDGGAASPATSGETETGSMSADTAALGGGAIADANEDTPGMTDAETDDTGLTNADGGPR